MSSNVKTSLQCAGHPRSDGTSRKEPYVGWNCIRLTHASGGSSWAVVSRRSLDPYIPGPLLDHNLLVDLRENGHCRSISRLRVPRALLNVSGSAPDGAGEYLLAYALPAVLSQTSLVMRGQSRSLADIAQVFLDPPIPNYCASALSGIRRQFRGARLYTGLGLQIEF